MTKMKIIVIMSNTGEDAEKLGPSYFAHGNVKQYYHYGKVWQFLIKLDM